MSKSFSSCLFDFKNTCFYRRQPAFLITEKNRCFKEKYWVPVSVNYTSRVLLGHIKCRLGPFASAYCVWRRQIWPPEHSLKKMSPDKLSVIFSAMLRWRSTESCNLHHWERNIPATKKSVCHRPAGAFRFPEIDRYSLMQTACESHSRAAVGQIKLWMLQLYWIMSISTTRTPQK